MSISILICLICVADFVISRSVGVSIQGYSYSTNDPVVFTAAGNGLSSVNDGVGTFASFKWPFGVASDYFNAYLYVS